MIPDHRCDLSSVDSFLSPPRQGAAANPARDFDVEIVVRILCDILKGLSQCRLGDFVCPLPTLRVISFCSEYLPVVDGRGIR